MDRPLAMLIAAILCALCVIGMLLSGLVWYLWRKLRRHPEYHRLAEIRKQYQGAPPTVIPIASFIVFISFFCIFFSFLIIEALKG